MDAQSAEAHCSTDRMVNKISDHGLTEKVCECDDDDDDHFKVRQVASASELSFHVGLCAKEGWYPGVYDANSLYQQDPTGFHIAEIDGVPIGCISAVKYGDGCAAIDMFVMKPSFRGKGYGYRMWSKVTKKLGHRNICLDSAAAKVKMYQKSGFKGMGLVD